MKKITRMQTREKGTLSLKKDGRGTTVSSNPLGKKQSPDILAQTGEKGTIARAKARVE